MMATCPQMPEANNPFQCTISNFAILITLHDFTVPYTELNHVNLKAKMAYNFTLMNPFFFI